MARQDKDEDPKAWVQSNAEFHQDWAEKENTGRHVRWRTGLSIESSSPAEKNRRYAVQGPKRRGRRWFVWLLLLAIIGGGIAFVASDRARTRDVLQRIERAIAAIRKSI